jgi:hypothetical protein
MRQLCQSLGAALLAVSCLLALAHAASAAPRQAQTTCIEGGRIFIHSATAANSAGDWTDLDNDITNGCPQAGVVVTATYTPGAVYDTHALGVWYNGTTQKWSIFHEDLTPVPLGATYNVYASSGGIYANETMFTVTATTANSGLGMLATGDTGSNFPPVVTPNWSVGGVYDNRVLGVLWAPNPGQWYMIHEDATAIPVGASYNVWWYGGGRVTQTATTSNSNQNYTLINNSTLNNLPGALVWVISLYGTVGYDNHALGVWYAGGPTSGYWTIFHQDRTAIPIGATYVVVFYP